MTLLRAAVVAVVGCTACEIVGGYESFEAQLPVAPHRCDVLGESSKGAIGASLVLTKRDNGECFWIDQTEVTVAQYAEFLASAPESLWDGTDAALCAWKTGGPSDPVSISVGDQKAEDDCVKLTIPEKDPFNEGKPIRCVDWCDALAYCKWANKDLCDSVIFTNLGTGQDLMPWPAACSNGFPYPYGKTKVDLACNIGFPRDDCTNHLSGGACGPTFPGSTFPGSPPPSRQCKSPQGAVDMVGNVAEWSSNCDYEDPAPEDPVTAPAATVCNTRGGSFADDTSVNCQTKSQSLQKPRSGRGHDLGFRCCAPLSDDEKLAVGL